VAAPWQLELLAQSPDIQHPSVVCESPDGRIFAAEDPMDIRVPADAAQGRIICFHPDGRRTVFAEKLHAVFGLQYLAGKLYVLHNPKFTVFEDGGDAGRNPLDLIENTNPNPWALDWNDHIPANFRLALDGHFYLAVGDKGLYGATGRDGSRVYLHGGGILRLRPDGTALEVYSTGVRNILDVALTSDGEVFTYDNTDEHDWMGRLTHMVDGGFYGYPHDFVPRRPYTLWMIHDFGGGAATGAFANTEDALPTEYRDNLFIADFGKRQVTRVVLERDGATFKKARHEDLFSDMPDSFRPVGIAPSADGRSILICDWQHRDTKSEAEVGRLWKITLAGETKPQPKPDWFLPLALGKASAAAAPLLVAGLAHPAQSVRLAAQRELARRRESAALREFLANSANSARARSHALWALDALDHGASARAEIMAAADSADVFLAAQAIRQLGQRRAVEARPLIEKKLAHASAPLRFQAATALGRIARAESVPALLPALAEEDFFTRYAVFTALHRIGLAQPGAWEAILNGLRSENARIREGVVFAARDAYRLELIEAAARLAGSDLASLESREQALAIASGLARQTQEWRGEWWAYHPALAPAPPKTTEWAGTPLVRALLEAQFLSNHYVLRFNAIRGIAAAGEASLAPRLREGFAREVDEQYRIAILEALVALRDPELAELLAGVIRPDTSSKLLEAALETARKTAAWPGEKLPERLEQPLRELLTTPQWVEGGLRSLAISALGQAKSPGENAPVLATLAKNGRGGMGMRLAAIFALGNLGGEVARDALLEIMRHSDGEIRAFAFSSIAKLRDPAAVPDLLEAWAHPSLKATAARALLQISDARALPVYIEELGSANPAQRSQAREALEPFRAQALPLLRERLGSFPPGLLAELGPRFPELADDIARLEKPAPTTADYIAFALAHPGDPARGQAIYFDETSVACFRCHLVGGEGRAVGPDMTGIGAQFPRSALIEHIVDPAKSVREGYNQVIIETKDDEVFSGLIKSESAEAITFLDASAQLQTIRKDQIKSRTASRLSLMPEGLHLGLTPEAFTDLVAYLESLKGTPASGESKQP